MKSAVANWVLGVAGTIAVGALVYSTTASWQNARAIEAQATLDEDRIGQLSRANDARLGAMAADIKAIKRAFISLLVEKRPNKTEMAKDLVSDASLKGINDFNSGDLPTAYATWKNSAARGDADSAFAIATAKDYIEQQLKDPSLPADTRVKFEAALKASPKVEEINGVYVLKKPGVH